MQNVLVELSEMARQITAQIDTRSARLEALIRQADERIAAMNAQPPAKGLPSAASTSQAPPASLPPEPSESPALDPRHAQVYALADQGRSSKDIAQQLNRPSGEIELILALRR
jgi:DNA-binding NarL/FixJ family response regulator